MRQDSHSDSYAKAGVDVTAGYRAVELIKKHAAKTVTPGVLGGLGGFGGMFMPDLAGLGEPVLVSGTDGVGTKLRVAFLMDKHETIGIDCVAMCVNDIICAGAAPLFFLDYLVLGQNVPELVERIVSGVSEGCVQAGCALVGGETAEHPGFYPPGEYDLAGFAVGLADRSALIGPQRVCKGDVLLALSSSGVHSNGFSLIRKVFDAEGGGLNRHVPELGATLGETLLTPTRIYAKPVLELLKKVDLHALCHITGGGFYENIPRALPDECMAVIEGAKLRTPPIFELISKAGGISTRDMFNTFNMGVGMVAVLPEPCVDEATRVLKGCDIDAYVMGAVAAGDHGVNIA